MISLEAGPFCYSRYGRWQNNTIIDSHPIVGQLARFDGQPMKGATIFPAWTFSMFSARVVHGEPQRKHMTRR